MHDQTIQQQLFEQCPGVISDGIHCSVKKLQEELSRFGLTHNLSKIYIYLGKYGPNTASDIVKALKLPRTEAYNQLKALMRKGLVHATMRHPMRFTALPLEKAIWSIVDAEKQRLNYLELNSKNVIRLWSTIPSLLRAKFDDGEKRFQILEGTNQIYSKIAEIIAGAEEVQLLCSQNEFMKIYHNDAFDRVTQTGKSVRVITKTSKFISLIGKSCAIQIKKMPEEISEHLCFVTTKNSLLFLIRDSKENPLKRIALWTDSRPLIYPMRILFDYTWCKSI